MKRLALFVFVICVFATNSPARAQVTRIEFTRVESPTFDGRVFGNVGQYEKLVTEDDRLGSGDPRPSVEERYRSHGGYVSRVVEAARLLQSQRFLLQEDVTRIIEVAQRIGPSL